MAQYGNSDDDDDDDRGMFGGTSSSRTASVARTTPVLDNFSISLSKILLKDNIKYYAKEREVNQLLKFLQKREKHHTFIIGEVGIGRHSLVKAVVQKIQDKNVGIQLKDLSFKLIDFDSIVAGTKYRGQFEERFKAITNELEKTDNVILYFENISTFLFEDDNWNFGYSFNQLLKSKVVRIIAVLTADEYEIFLKKFKSLHRYINIIKLFPPNSDETLEILKCHLLNYQNEYSCTIDEITLKNLVELSDIYVPDEFQPSKSISLLEEICVTKNINLLNYVSPDSDFFLYSKEYDSIIQRIEAIKYEKNEVVKRQRYEEGALLRDEEKKLEQKAEKVKNKLEVSRKDIELSITIDDVMSTLSDVTGISVSKIVNGEDIPNRLSNYNIYENTLSLPRFEISQTQSILHGDQIIIKRGTAFVLMPHTKEFDDIFNYVIKPAMETNDLSVLKADNIYQPGNILSQVWHEIRSAEVIVADVSDHNPNVIFELGLCYGIQRCPIILTRDPAELPFNLRNLRYIHYENTTSGAQKLREKLTSTIAEFLSAVRIQM
jgi:hypothetical protein